MSEDPALLRKIFTESVEIEDGQKRNEYLAVACGADSVLRRRIEGLIEASKMAGRFLGGTEDRIEASAHQVPGSAAQLQSSANPSVRRFGDYELLEEIARGGMGVVFKARQTKLDRVVAVKLILSGEFASREQALRFRAEAEAAARLQHPNIVRIHETGEQEGQPFFSMDYVEGGDLVELVREKPLPATRAAGYVKTIAEAIHYAHEQGILHRDLKPSNVLIDHGNEPRITDFGLAKRMHKESFLTVTGDVMGSPNFMPPEQAGAKVIKAGRYSDVYALGGILFYLVTGRAPFVADTVAETVHHVLNTEPVSPHLLNPSVPGDIATICLKCLEKEPAKRFQTAQELADELGRFVKGEPILARPASRPARIWRWCRRKPAIASLVVAVSCLTLAVAIGATVAAIRISSARKSERVQRQHAEEISVQLQLQRAEDLFEDDNAASALVYLGRVLRQDPNNLAAAERLLSALTWRSFGLPAIAPFHHAAQIYCARFSPDGLRVATSADDKTTRIWDARSGQPLLEPLQHNGPVKWVEFSPDGERVVTAAADGTARVWDTRSGQPVTPPLKHGSGVNMAQFSPDGRRVVTASADRHACLWDALSGELVTKPLSHESIVNTARFSPDGAYILTASDDQYARVWDSASGQMLVQTPPLSAGVKHAEFSPDGQRFVTAAGSIVCLWNTQTGEKLSATTHRAAAGSARFSPDGYRLITASLDSTCRICDARTLANLVPPLVNNGPVRMAAFSPLGLSVVTCSEDSTARVWDPGTGQPLTNPLKHLQWVSFAHFSPDGRRILVQSAEHDARVWEVSPGQARPLPLVHHAGVGSIRFSPDGRIVVTACEDGAARIWDRVTGALLFEPLRHSMGVSSADFSPNGQWVVTASSDKTAQIWDARSGKSIGAPMLHEKKVTWAEFSPDGERIVTGSSDKTSRVWNARTGEAITQPLIHEERVDRARFSPDGSFVATVSGDGFVRVWEAHTGRLVAKLWQRAGVFDVCFSPDGRRLVTACKANFALLWDLRTGDPLTLPLKHDNWVHSAQFSSDGKRVVTASADHSARVWDGYTGQPLTEPLGHADVVLSARFSQDGQRIATASMDRSARVWDTRTGLPVTEPLKHGGGVMEARFSPDGQSLVTTAQDHTARVWQIPSAQLPVPAWVLDLADSVAGQRFNPQGLVESFAETNLIRLKQQLTDSATTDFYTTWGKWFFADRGLRTISPNSEITIPEYLVQRIRDNQLAGLREAVQLMPTNALALARLADQVLNIPSRDYEQKYVEADGLTRRAITLAPKDPMVALARADYLNRTAHGPEALSLLKRASLQEPKDVEFWLTYGIIHRLSGNLEEAHGVLSRAIELAVADDETTAFHRKEALLQRFGVLKELHRDDEAVADFCRARNILARDPSAHPGELDMTRFFNLGLKDGWGVGNDLASLPSGLQTFAGVRFDVRGILQLCGGGPGLGSGLFPPRITGLPVGQKCDRVHFLHAAGYNAPEGSKIGAYVMHFASGQTRELPLLQAQNIHCSLWNPWRARDLGKDCITAWRGSNSNSENLDAELCLYKTTWENPMPSDEVRTIDFVSALGSATPFVLAITVE